MVETPTPRGLGRYFTRRERRAGAGFEQEYWHVVVDPDGRVRNRLEEREQHLADLSRELAFVRGLRPGRLLDVGCGLGFFLSGVPDAWDRHGVEVSAFAAGHAERWATIHTGTLESAGYDEASFDVVVFHHVIEHLDDPLPTLELSVHCCVREGGCCWGHRTSTAPARVVSGERYRLLHDPTHVSLFTADSTHRLLRDHGFVVDEVDFPYFDTRHFSKANLLGMLDATAISPPFFGSFMTFYCHRPRAERVVRVLQRLGAVSPAEVARLEDLAEAAVVRISEALGAGGRLWLTDGDRGGVLAQACALGTPAHRYLPEGSGEQAPASGDALIMLVGEGGGFVPVSFPSATIVVAPEELSAVVAEADMVLPVPDLGAGLFDGACLAVTQALLAEALDRIGDGAGGRSPQSGSKTGRAPSDPTTRGTR